MNPQDQLPEEENVELEAIARQGIEAEETRKGIEANTEAAAFKLNEIEQNQEAQILQSMKSTKETIEAIAPSLKAQERMANIFSSLMTNLEGPAGKDGKTPQKGVDYFTPEEQKKFVEVVQSRVRVPEDGKDGKDGADGKNPLTVSRTRPRNPQVGDLWFKT